MPQGKTFAEWTLPEKRQRSTLGHHIEEPLGGADKQRMDDAVHLVDQAGIQQRAGQHGATHQVDVLAAAVHSS